MSLMPPALSGRFFTTGKPGVIYHHVNEQTNGASLILKPWRASCYQGASRAAPGKSGLHERGEGERVIVLESWASSKATLWVKAWILCWETNTDVSFVT